MLKLVKDENGMPEMYAGIQGEGIFVGSPTFFVRLAGCNLRCSYCDSKFTWEEGISVNESLILQRFELSGMPSMTITGGEPLLQDLSELINHTNKRVFIETNGTVKIRSVLDFSYNVFFNVSPKLSNSGQTLLEKYMETLSSYLYYGRCQLKFVINNSMDMLEAMVLCEKVKLKSKIPIVFQPNGQLEKNDVQKLWNSFIKFASKYEKFDLRFIPQQHVIFFGRKRGV